ncbi:uncharacterized protein LOC144492869 [Mustelus asterias]
MGEGTSKGGTALVSASTSQLTIPDADTSVGPVSGEASGSLSGEHDAPDNVHRVEEGTSEASGGLPEARTQLDPRLHAGPLRSLLPQLLEMQQQSQGMQEGLTATLDQLRGCWEESQSFQEDQLLPVLHGSQANTARGASAVENLRQRILTMSGRLQAMAESQQATAESQRAMAESQQTTAEGLNRILEVLWPMAERLKSLQEIQRDSAETQRATEAALENVAQSQRIMAEGLQSMAQSQRALAAAIDRWPLTQVAIAEGLTAMGRTQVVLQDWQCQVMLELLELIAEALPSHGVSQGPTGIPREEEGLESMLGPSSQETVAVATPSDSPLPDTGASRGSGMKRVSWNHPRYLEAGHGPHDQGPPHASQAKQHGRQLAPFTSDVHSGE